MTMQDLNALHRKLCPNKVLGNFWRSTDYKAAVASLESTAGDEVVKRNGKPSRGHPAQTLVHPIIALAFMHWADAPAFYTRLQKILTSE